MRRVVSVLFSFLLVVGCGGPTEPAHSPSSVAPQHPGQRAPLVGVTTREKVLETFPDWQAAFEKAEPDPEASLRLAKVPAGAHVDVYFGTWCSDSRHEVPRLWKAMDRAGGPLPFTVRWIGVDRKKLAPEVAPELDLKRVPTFVVRRGGVERSRIVEHAPRGIETELADLLLAE